MENFMKNILIWIPLSSLLFLGCTKTIKIDNKREVVNQEPIVYHEVATTAPTYELENVSEQSVNTTNVHPYTEESTVISNTKPFNIEPLDAYDKMLENPNLLILDVRTPGEIPRDGKIANSIMIPLQVLGQNLNRLDKSKEIIVYCHTGNRSTEATKLLRRNGFDAINMRGGIEAWKRNHLEVKWK